MTYRRPKSNLLLQKKRHVPSWYPSLLVHCSFYKLFRDLIIFNRNTGKCYGTGILICPFKKISCILDDIFPIFNGLISLSFSHTSNGFTRAFPMASLHKIPWGHDAKILFMAVNYFEYGTVSILTCQRIGSIMHDLQIWNDFQQWD